MKPISVILDTDIGSDIDDTWALAMMLKCPELDPKLIVSATDDTTYRAKLICRMLEVAGRTDIPVAIGTRTSDKLGPQAGWIEGYGLSDYPGRICPDGVSAIVKTVNESPETVTLIGIGPACNIAGALASDPELAGKARFVGMYGDIASRVQRPRKAEYNVKRDPAAFRATLSAPWRDSIITPLDTCGRVHLEGERHSRIRDSQDPLACAIMENYRMWATGRENTDPDQRSSTLHDTVAIYLAFATDLLEVETMALTVSDKGLTIPDRSGSKVAVAIEWRDLEGFCDFLVARLLG